ncbi:MAG: MerR family transcriptional regulator [Flavobacteriales bacterium]
MSTEREYTKRYYSISEVAAKLNVNTSLIRFWEKEFSAIKPKKNKKGNRLFTPQDIIYLHKVYALVKEQGFTLEGARNQLKKKQSTPPSDKENVVKHLHHIKSELLKIKAEL